MNKFLVGGAVRDILLNILPNDRDYVVVGSTHDEMIAAGFSRVGRDFPVYLHPVTKEEYALARTERKSGKGYNGFTVSFDPTTTLEEDLKRRDISINAMAMTDNGQIIDPFGGVQDLHDKILRHTSEAFADDPLRVLRLARFAARYGFKIAPETMELAKQIVTSGELSYLPLERIWTELEKGFKEIRPSVMLDVLSEVGAFDVAPLNKYPLLNTTTLKTYEYCFDFDMKIMLAFSFSMMSQDDFLALKVPGGHYIRSKQLSCLLSFACSDLDVTFAFLMVDILNTLKSDLDTRVIEVGLCFFRNIYIDFYTADFVWSRHMQYLELCHSEIKKLDMKAIVADGDMKTVKSRVRDAKINAIGKAYQRVVL